MKTKLPIHLEWLSQTVTKFYHFRLLGYKIDIYPNGSWEGERVRR